ncbi:MAG: enoyl-CoA hydratase/isomerase family protein [Candidatus Eisenbacteria bacterium]|uniref:Enoyl-CoA hydratase/isomerase family protein n=1 Tax=Eiseniibacteriota bacterium TaxID=2212470 RepID=A0A948RZU9_UNCEI|nr:enoyl-CoA hydratase/isomerase family protein [Candidatus Eisenbacteria bacterium]MBU1951134.1 enoyl-CoA hydratase/isomerase family protein [Candidatus Eisenbacteria bacterium]MBU2693001.1 enoyl-CoA hydratase/isomerase family protein [Candidatus Eisenbacteria bacterium]
MSWETVILKKEAPLAIVTINRPDKLNALNAQSIRELKDLFRQLGEDDEVLVVILTGAGDKAFIAGADIKELSELNAQKAKELSHRGQVLCDIIEHLGKPVIAAVNGYALGGGCEIALSCTLRVASETARLGLPEVTLGLIPGYAGTQRLPRVVGKGRALAMILLGEPIKAQQALEFGLVNLVAPPDQLLEATKEMALKIASRGPLAVRYAMEAVHRGLEISFTEGCYLEANLFGLLAATEDMKEGTTAFLEKRKAVFKGC